MDDVVDGLDLWTEVLRHGGTVSLVVRKYVVPECLAFCIEDDSYLAVGKVLLQPAQHVDDTFNCARLLTLGICERRKGVVRAV